MEPQLDPTEQTEEQEQDYGPYTDAEQELPPDQPVEPLVWQASEYVHHQKGPAWYVGLFGILAVLTVVAALTHEWFAIAVFVCMFLAVVVYGSRQPRTLTYSLDNQNLRIEDKAYPLNTFRSFSVTKDVAWHAIDLEPTQRFMPRLTVLFDDNNLDQIVERLSSQLPRLDREPDFIERAARFLRF